MTVSICRVRTESLSLIKQLWSCGGPFLGGLILPAGVDRARVGGGGDGEKSVDRMEILRRWGGGGGLNIVLVDGS